MTYLRSVLTMIVILGYCLPVSGRDFTYQYKEQTVQLQLNTSRFYAEEPVFGSAQETRTQLDQLGVIRDAEIVELHPSGRMLSIDLSQSVTPGEYLEILQELRDSGIAGTVSPVFKTGGIDQTYSSELWVKSRQYAMNGLVNLIGGGIVEGVESRPWHRGLYKIRLVPGVDVLDVVNRIQGSEGIDFAQPNFIRFIRPFTTDTYYDSQWGLLNTGQYGGTPGADISIEDAWNISRGSPDIVIAVLDDGVDITHPDLVEQLITGYDATDDDNDPAPNSWDAHGTNCAGIAAARTDNAMGIAGVAPNCLLMPVRIAYTPHPDSTSWVSYDSWIVDGLVYAADQGADVISNSWGGGSQSSVIDAAVSYAMIHGRHGKGSVVLFATGNNDQSSIHYPASLDSVISVGASSMCDERCSWFSCDNEWTWGSNYGTGLDVVAPGVKLYSTDNTGAGGYSGTDYYSSFNGTSGATPFVAGISALVLSMDTSLTGIQVKDIIEQTADKTGNYTYDQNLPNGTWNNEMGYGRVNAYSALKTFTVDLALTDGTAPVGETDTISVLMENGLEVAGIQFDLVDSPDFLSLSDVIPTDRLEGFSIGMNEQPDGSATIIVYSLSSDVVPPGSGTILNLVLAVDTMGVGTVGLSLANGIIADSAGNNMENCFFSGSLFEITGGSERGIIGVIDAGGIAEDSAWIDLGLSLNTPLSGLQFTLWGTPPVLAYSHSENWDLEAMSVSFNTDLPANQTTVTITGDNVSYLPVGSYDLGTMVFDVEAYPDSLVTSVVISGSDITASDTLDQSVPVTFTEAVLQMTTTDTIAWYGVGSGSAMTGTTDTVGISLDNRQTVGDISFRIQDTPDYLQLVTVVPSGRLDGYTVTATEAGDGSVNFEAVSNGNNIPVGVGEIVSLIYQPYDGVEGSSQLSLEDIFTWSPAGTLFTSAASPGSFEVILYTEPDVILSIGEGEAFPGDTGFVEIFMDNTEAIVGGVQFTIQDTPEQLTIIGAGTTDRTSGFSVGFNELVNGQAKVLAYSITGTTIDTGSGAVINVEYLLSDMPVSETLLGFTDIRISDPFGESLVAHGVDGVFRTSIDTSTAVRVRISEGETFPGSTDTLTLAMRNNDPVAGFQFTIRETPPWLTGVEVLTTGRTEAFSVVQNELADGTVRILGFNTTGVTIGAGNGDIAALIVQMTDTAETGSVIDMVFDEVTVSGSTGVEMPSFGVGNSFNVRSFTDTCTAWINIQDTTGSLEEVITLPLTISTPCEVDSLGFTLYDTTGAVTFDGIVADPAFTGLDVNFSAFPGSLVVGMNAPSGSPIPPGSHRIAWIDLMVSGSAWTGDSLTLLIHNPHTGVAGEYIMAAYSNGPVIYFMPVSSDYPGENAIPREFVLYQNYPNPFNPVTTFRFGLPEKGRVSLSVYNITGQLVAHPFNGEMNPGYHQLRWEGRTKDGLPAESGLYLYQVIYKNTVKTGKMMLIK